RRFRTLCKRNVARTRHQEAKRHGLRLRIAIRELDIVGLREQKLAPILRETGQAGTAALHLLDNFVAQQTAKPRADLCELLCGLRRNRLPSKKVTDEWHQRVGCRKLRARRFDIAFKMNDLALE